MYFVAFSLIARVLYDELNATGAPLPILAYIGVGLIFLGAGCMADGRRKSEIYVDVAGRVIFCVGFGINLINLVRVQ